MIANFHNQSILPRRKIVLANAIADIIGEKGGSILDVGCGDGEISEKVAAAAGASKIEGVETQLRPACKVPVKIYDGRTLPYLDGAFDYVMICDVLHHDTAPEVILGECVRVAKKAVIIKDHTSENFGEHLRLRAMDWVGNYHHHVHLEYNYLSRGGWTAIFDRCNIHETKREEKLPLYTGFLQAVFGRNLHFVNRLEHKP